MKVSIPKRLTVAAGAVLALAAGQVVAAPVFGVNQAATGGTYLGPQYVTGTQLNGNSSELLHFSDGDQKVTVNSGWMRIGTIFNDNTSGSTLVNAGSGTGSYGLYVTFAFETQYNAADSTGAAGAAGSVYDITSLTYNMYADVSGDTTFQTASSAGAGTEAAITGGLGDDALLAFGSLVPAPNVAGFNSGGGAYLNSLESFALCSGNGTATANGTGFAHAGCTSSIGTDYFYDPVPFFPLAFDAFNNTGNSLGLRNGDLLAITQGAGVITFQDVPEPGVLALLGAAMLGFGVTGRFRGGKG